MKLLFPVLLLFLINGCTNEPAPNAVVPTAKTPVAPLPSPSREANIPQAANAPADTDVPNALLTMTVCDFLSAADATRLIQCGKAVNPVMQWQGEDRTNGKCDYRCTDPFRVISLNVLYNAQSTINRAASYARNPAFEPITVPGAEGAYYLPAQNRISMWKSPYSITLYAPDISGDAKAAVLDAATKVMTKL